MIMAQTLLDIMESCKVCAILFNKRQMDCHAAVKSVICKEKAENMPQITSACAEFRLISVRVKINGNVKYTTRALPDFALVSYLFD